MRTFLNRFSATREIIKFFIQYIIFQGNYPHFEYTEDVIKKVIRN
jgi:hypothetical protein